MLPLCRRGDRRLDDSVQAAAHQRAMPDGAATAHLLRPKLVTILKEGYDLARFRRDAIAGATVAVVALPLSMAIAVAPGVSPERRLYTAMCTRLSCFFSWLLPRHSQALSRWQHSGVLVAVAWSMAERHEFARLMHAWPTALVLVVTLVLTLLFDLIAGIAAGCIVAAILAVFRRATCRERGLMFYRS
jgi:MFS superfamily sulfate permease-like transporter